MKENEYNEYYIKAEEWPSVKDEELAKDEEPLKDEAVTLEEETSSAEVHSSQKKNFSEAKKARRKKEDMLNKSTGLLVGAVAVAVVAGTLSTSTLEPVSVPTYVEVSYICPICSVENCEFWDGHLNEVTDIKVDGEEYTVWSGNEHQLGIRPVPLEEGIWRKVESRTSAIHMQDGSRAYIKYVPVEYIEYDMTINSGDDDRECLVPADDMMLREVMCAGDVTGEGDKHITLLELIYVPDGTKPQEENLTYELNGEYVADLPYVCMKSIPDTENLWLRISSTEKELDLEGMWKDTEVRVVDASVQKFELGSTMIFNENSRHRCTWYSSYSSHMSNGWGAPHDLIQQYEKHLYHFVKAGTDYTDLFMFYVEFANVKYEQIFDRWQEVNELALERGHNVWSPVYELEEYKCNGITYQIYLVEKKSDYGNSYELYCSPVQEKNCSVQVKLYDFSYETKDINSKTTLGEILTAVEFEMVNQILDCISLK